jgi:hypothetical protein
MPRRPFLSLDNQKLPRTARHAPAANRFTPNFPGQPCAEGRGGRLCRLEWGACLQREEGDSLATGTYPLPLRERVDAKRPGEG